MAHIEILIEKKKKNTLYVALHGLRQSQTVATTDSVDSVYWCLSLSPTLSFIHLLICGSWLSSCSRESISCPATSLDKLTPCFLPQFILWFSSWTTAKWGNYFICSATFWIMIFESWRKRLDYEGVPTEEGNLWKTEAKKIISCVGPVRLWERQESRQGWTELRERLSFQAPWRVHGEMVPSTPKACFCLSLQVAWQNRGEEKAVMFPEMKAQLGHEAKGLSPFWEEEEAWISAHCEELWTHVALWRQSRSPVGLGKKVRSSFSLSSYRKPEWTFGPTQYLQPLEMRGEWRPRVPFPLLPAGGALNVAKARTYQMYKLYIYRQAGTRSPTTCFTGLGELAWFCSHVSVTRGPGSSFWLPLYFESHSFYQW